MVDIENIDLNYLFKNIVVGVIILTIIYYFFSMIYSLFKSYSYDSLGKFFDKKYFSTSDFGLEGTDYLDFIVNIRTDDASDDCEMRGRYKYNKLEKIEIKGDGYKCRNLRSNNKL